MKVELYTDGACRGNGVVANPVAGVGCALLVPGQMPVVAREKLNFDLNTNNKAELYAVIKGFDLIYKFTNFKVGFEKHELVIYSDSAYFINGITNWINTWRENGWKTSAGEDVKNQDLWKTLDNVIETSKELFDISFVKVEGHSGNRWNDKCDRLANEAMDEK